MVEALGGAISFQGPGKSPNWRLRPVLREWPTEISRFVPVIVVSGLSCRCTTLTRGLRAPRDDTRESVVQDDQAMGSPMAQEVGPAPR